MHKIRLEADRKSLLKPKPLVFKEKCADDKCKGNEVVWCYGENHVEPSCGKCFKRLIGSIYLSDIKKRIDYFLGKPVI